MRQPGQDKRLLVIGLKRLRNEAGYHLRKHNHEDAKVRLDSELERHLKEVFRLATAQLEKLGHPQSFRES